MVIYTRTGDKGMTSLFSGQRVSKSDLRVDTYGTVDELNSIIGVVIAEVKSSRLPKPASPLAEQSEAARGTGGQAKLKVQSYSLKLKVELERIQKDLLSISSALANPSVNHELSTMNHLQKRVKEFENFIDKMTAQMPKLSNFILPGGGKTGAFLHLARAVCRRTERKVVALNNKEKIDRNIIIYFNRLSDLLFTMARFANFKEKRKEIIWTKR